MCTRCEGDLGRFSRYCMACDVFVKASNISTLYTYTCGKCGDSGSTYDKNFDLYCDECGAVYTETADVALVHIECGGPDLESLYEKQITCKACGRYYDLS